VDAPVTKPPLAWQPLTPAGVAAFAGGSFTRLLVVQIIIASIAAGAVVWFLAQDWFPIVSRAIENLPPEGAITQGILDWRGESPKKLADNIFLSIAVDLDHTGVARNPAHAQIEFGRTNFKMFSLFGFWKFSYPTAWRLAFNRGEVAPWWGAWAPPILAIAAALVVLALLLSWALLATLYAVPGWLLAFFANRLVTFQRSWRLAGAALMPGALLLTGAILCYTAGIIDPLQLMAAGVLHILLGWGYVAAGALALPRDPIAELERTNPFGRPKAG
jgi:hypothetical protein